MAESCISWAAAAPLISIFTDPPPQRRSEPSEKGGQQKRDLHRAGERYLHRVNGRKVSSTFERKGSADGCGSYS